jgi:hypothetical protein
MLEVSNEEWQEAHRIISLRKKQSAMTKSNQIKAFIKEKNRTFWKQDSGYSTSYIHVHVSSEENHSHYATVYKFEVHSNGRNKISHNHLSQNELDEFLDGVSQQSIDDKRDREDCECECECRCSDEEVELPKVNIKSISEAQFKKVVQSKILDEYSIGLQFK